MDIPTKQKLLRFLRNNYLLSTAEKIIFVKNLWKFYRDNRRVSQANPGFAFPPLRMMLEAYGSISYQNYMDLGKAMAKAVADYLNQFYPNGEPLTILDWGCGPGRVLRFLDQALGGRQTELWGSDYDPQTIAWCQANILNYQFKENGLEPPLLFEDNYFDALYCISVYTHLPEDLGCRWFQENLRAVKPGGYIIFTVHGDPFQDYLLADEFEQYRTSGFVERSGVVKGSRLFTTFHSPEYLERKFFKGHEVAHHSCLSGVIGKQDVWVMRK